MGLHSVRIFWMVTPVPCGRRKKKIRKNFFFGLQNEPSTNQQPILAHYSTPSTLLSYVVSVQSVNQWCVNPSNEINKSYSLTWRYKLICSVIRTEMLRYFRLIFVPSVMNRNRKHPKAHDQINASKLYCECNCTESFNHSALKNPRNSSAKMNAADTITSTDRCGPRRCELENKTVRYNRYTDLTD